MMLGTGKRARLRVMDRAGGYEGVNLPDAELLLRQPVTTPAHTQVCNSQPSPRLYSLLIECGTEPSIEAPRPLSSCYSASSARRAHTFSGKFKYKLHVH